MKIELQKDNNLFISPETEFEVNVLSKFHKPKAVLKCGMDMTDVLGISISSTMNEKEDKSVKLIIEFFNGSKYWNFYEGSNVSILGKDFIKNFNTLVDPKNLPIGSIFVYNIEE